jgi:RsiW-degrading membrane proteinase PrsW (M82 family)
MPYISLLVLLLMIVVNLIFRFASLFRLTIPVLYAIVVPVFFPDWLHENETLVTIIWFTLIGLVILSWIVTIRKRIRLRHTQPDSVQS